MTYLIGQRVMVTGFSNQDPILNVTGFYGHVVYAYRGPRTMYGVKLTGCIPQAPGRAKADTIISSCNGRDGFPFYADELEAAD